MGINQTHRRLNLSIEGTYLLRQPLLKDNILRKKSFKSLSVGTQVSSPSRVAAANGLRPTRYARYASPRLRRYAPDVILDPCACHGC
jgi:hypothetical protein